MEAGGISFWIAGSVIFNVLIFCPKSGDDQQMAADRFFLYLFAAIWWPFEELLPRCNSTSLLQFDNGTTSQYTTSGLCPENPSFKL